jgi:hypothetical protein
MAEQGSNSIPRSSLMKTQADFSERSSVPSSETLQGRLTPDLAMSHASSTSQPLTGPAALRSQITSVLPGSSSRSADYIHPFHPSVTLPGTILDGYSEFPHFHRPFASVPNIGSQVQMSGMQGQKRAYRQRRKDPSCDACRERKVKVSVVCFHYSHGTDG